MLRKIFSLLLIGLLCVFAGCESDETMLDLTPGTEANISVDELIRRMAQVTDPKGIYAKAKTYRMKQNVDSTDGKEKNTYTSVILYKAPGFIKQISMKNGKPFNVILTRGEKCWYINPVTGKSVEIPEGTPRNLVNTFNGMIKPGNTLKHVFPEIKLDMIRDDRTMKKYYRLVCRVQDPNIAPYVFYVNSKTYLITKFETVLYGADGSKSLYTAYSDNYVLQNGFRQPRRSLIIVGGKTDVSNVTSFELNCELSPTEFDISVPWNQRIK